MNIIKFDGDNFFRLGIIIIAIMVMIALVSTTCYFFYFKSSKIIHKKNDLFFLGRSKSETLSIHAFKHLLEEKGYDSSFLIIGYRPSFLKNPLTKKNLEIDAYYPPLKLGIEYNGIQHYVFSDKFYQNNKKGREDFEKSKQRDNLKKQLALENNINLIVIPYYVDNVSNNKKTTNEERYNRIKLFLTKYMIKY